MLSTPYEHVLPTTMYPSSLVCFTLRPAFQSPLAKVWLQTVTLPSPSPSQAPPPNVTSARHARIPHMLSFISISPSGFSPFPPKTQSFDVVIKIALTYWSQLPQSKKKKPRVGKQEYNTSAEDCFRISQISIGFSMFHK